MEPNLETKNVTWIVLNIIYDFWFFRQLGIAARPIMLSYWLFLLG